MKLRWMVRCGCCAGVMAICAWLAIPVGEICVTLQTFGVFLTLLLLGGRKGTAVVSVYLLLGAVGLPVFTGFQGGYGVLLGPTGGYLWGFLLCCLCFWLLEEHLPGWLLLILGQLVCYCCGTAWFYFAYAQGGLWAVLLKCVVPYLIPDACKLLLARYLAVRLKKIV